MLFKYYLCSNGHIPGQPGSLHLPFSFFTATCFRRQPLIISGAFLMVWLIATTCVSVWGFYTLEPSPMSPNRHIKLSVSSWSVLSHCHYMNCSTSVVVVIVVVVVVVVVVAAAGVVCLCVWLCQWVSGLSWVVATTWSVLLQCSQWSPTPHLCNTAVCHTQRPDEALQLLEGVKLYEIYVSV